LFSWVGKKRDKKNTGVFKLMQSINKVTLFTKRNKPFISEVIKFLKTNFSQCNVFMGKNKEKIPKEAFKHKQDVLLSYISPWVIPKEILSNTRLWNINFHPGPPEYPGVGCTNFAVYNNEKIYGVIAHIMKEKVDTGKIIKVKRFPIDKNDGVYQITNKAYKYLFEIFKDIFGEILKKREISFCDEIWQRKPYTRKELEKLCKITVDMSKEEIEKRIKATTYPNMPGAYIELCGYKFGYNKNR
jgi:methionyl-tRNA formyltransferase